MSLPVLNLEKPKNNEYSKILIPALHFGPMFKWFFRTRDRQVYVTGLYREMVCLFICGNADIEGPEGVS
jgi:hypothetical protein